MADGTRARGIGLSGALFILFLALRLTDHIDWAWYWVAAPLWMPLAEMLVVALPVMAWLSIADWSASRRRAARRAAAEAAKRAGLS